MTGFATYYVLILDSQIINPKHLFILPLIIVMYNVGLILKTSFVINNKNTEKIRYWFKIFSNDKKYFIQVYLIFIWL